MGLVHTNETPKHEEGIHLFIDFKKSSEASSFVPIKNDVSNVFSEEDFENNLIIRQEFAQRKFIDDQHNFESIRLGIKLKKKKSKEKTPSHHQIPP